jgi:mRNA interferase MazF
MNIGQLVLLPFPFTDKVERKVRPALIIGTTKDQFDDVIVCAISSVIPTPLNENDIVVSPSKLNGLRVISCIKTDRIATIRSTQIVLVLGNIEPSVKTAVCGKLSTLNCYK